MKYRYVFEKYGEVCGTNELTKQHLIDVKNGQSNYLIDVKESTYYDVENNEWKDIEGDE